MGVFESKIKDMSLASAFGSFPSGVSKEKAEELWKRYDENGDGSLNKEEAKHMVIDLAELTVEWAKSNITSIMEEANEGPEIDSQTLIADNEHNIELAYKMMKDEKVIEQILKDFDTDGDGQISKEEFLAKATEGYDILQPAKKAKTAVVCRVHEKLEVNGKTLAVHKEIVGPNVYVSVDGWFAGPQPAFSLASIASHGLVSVAGQIGRVPAGGALASGGVGPETTQCLENIRLILKACGLSMDNLLKVQVYLKDNDGKTEKGGRFYEMNAAYSAFFKNVAGNRLPPRITVGCGTLAGGANVEIDAQASL